MLEGDEGQGAAPESHEAAAARVRELAVVEQEVARLSDDRRRLGANIIGRIAQIEAECGADVAEAVVEAVIEILRGRRRALS